MKKRLRKKIISICFDKLPIDLYKKSLYKKSYQNALNYFYRATRKCKKDGYKVYVSLTGPEGTVYKKFKK